MTELVALPEPDLKPWCSRYATEVGLKPAGTAIDATLIVLVGLPLPWPKKVFDHESMAGVSQLFDSPVGNARVLATLPESISDGTVVCWWLDERGQTHKATFNPEGNDELVSCLTQLGEVDPDKNSFLVQVEDPGPAALVCTHGSRDVCCGAEGTKMMTDLADLAPQVDVYRVSHTGGHRFAPTAMTFPDGRMWAYVSADEMISILDQTGDPRTLAEKCRGWWGAPTGPSQVGEVAVFRKLGWALDQTLRGVSQDEHDPNQVTVAVDHDAWSIRVELARQVPTIACRKEGGLPAKPGREYAATDPAKAERQ